MAILEPPVRGGARPGPAPAAARRGGAAVEVPGNGVTGGHGLSPAFLVYMLAMMMPFGMSLGGIELSPVRLVLMVMIIPLMLNLFSGKYGRLRATDALLLAFVFWQAVSIGYWHGSRTIQFTGSVGIEAIGGYMVGRAFIRSVEDFEALARIFGIFVLITVPIAAIEAFTGFRPVLTLFEKLPVINTFNASTAEKRLGLFRGQVNFTHTIHYGIFAALGFSMSFLVVRPYVDPAWGWMRSAAMGLGSFFSLSSGGFLVFVLQAGLIGWRWLAGSIANPWVVFLALGATFYLIIEVLSDRTAFMVLLSYAAFSAHNAYWRTILFDYAMQNVADSPWVGVGLNDWYRPSWITHPSLDNFWAYIALVHGVPAFIFLAVATLLPLIYAMRMKIPAVEDRLMRARAAWVLTMIGLIMALCTVHVWGKIYSLTFFVIGAGVWFYDAGEKLARGERVASPGPSGAGVPANAGGDTGPARQRPAAAAAENTAEAATGAAAPARGPVYTRFPDGPAGAGGRPGRRGQ